MMYKKFVIDNLTYIFCVEDFEIFKITQVENVVNVLKEIKTEKEKSDFHIEWENLKDNFPQKKIINTIGINLANGCNLNCTYCYISAFNKNRRLLSKEKFGDILNFLKNSKEHPITMYFTGAGEPTLNFILLKQVPSLCREYGFDNCAFDLTTNGTILTKEMIEFFKLNKFTINISLDGNEKIHNISRIYPNGKGSFEDVFNNINLLKKNNIDFVCKTTVQPDNKNLFETFSFFEKNKIDFFFTIVTNSFDNHFPVNFENLKVFEEQMNIIIIYYRKLIEDNNKIHSLKILNDIKTIHYGTVNKIACLASRDGFFIDIEGNIFTCSYHCNSKDLSVGDIYNGIDYNKIVKNNWFAKPVDDYSACKNCWMKHLCAGSCFAIKWLENKNTEIPSEYLCKTNDIYWSAIIKLYILIYPYIIEGKNVNFKDINDGK